ncbi:hypothetical protein Bca52824_033533 [Brassica carinata]|uniref:Aminotransferase-like plant mobile domain-containing protein n=1 Tax=Brassica carinata TaxID=52824 RepID=A0A8X7SEI3_BRACI|nr:hypothetical protein Bca52824_033533 [Brassica carinata]
MGLKTLSLSVSFKGWRLWREDFKTWATKMSALGSPVFAALDGSGEETKAKVQREWLMLKKYIDGRGITQPVWMKNFMDSGHELEHVAFLVLWLSYFVFPSNCYTINEAVFPVVHLSSSTRITLAPAVLAHLYADLTLLKYHVRGFTRSESITLSALFKLVQVWTWERFRNCSPYRIFCSRTAYNTENSYVKFNTTLQQSG